MDNQVINNIKSLGIDMIQTAGSGHPGIVLGAAPIIYTLFKNHININTSDSKWVNRDRFILSSGHGSALLYATLYMAGYNITIDDLKQFRQINSVTPGHPEYQKTVGVDISTGPLGEGIAMAVGMAIAEKKLKQETIIENSNRWKGSTSLIDHNIYVLCGDGDIMEGISYEAMSLAGTMGLDNLIILYDSNSVSLDSNTEHTFKTDISSLVRSMGWDYIYVKNGENIKDIDHSIEKAKRNNKPTLIEIKTIIGRGTFFEGTSQAHGSLLKDDELAQLKRNLGCINPFYVDEQAKNYFSKSIATRCDNKYQTWAKNYQTWNNINHKNIGYFLKNETMINSNIFDLSFDSEKRLPMREWNHIILNKIALKIPNLIAGSADLASSTGCYLEEMDEIYKNHFDGRNIRFGVRENSMAAIMNGLATYGYLPICSTFLVFSDYLKPSLRLTALMNLPVIYLFTHDSINIGQDGPTHQPIEHLSSLRSTPNMAVFRPCDPNEILGCYEYIFKNKIPATIIISKMEIPLLNNSSKNISNGGYVIRKEKNKLDGIIIATGTEVHTAIHIAEDLIREQNLDIRVVSMPNRELFLKQNNEYQEEILPKGYKKIVIEAGAQSGWEGFVYRNDYLCTLNKFGTSAKKEAVLKYMNFDYDTIKSKILKLLK